MIATRRLWTGSFIRSRSRVTASTSLSIPNKEGKPPQPYHCRTPQGVVHSSIPLLVHYFMPIDSGLDGALLDSIIDYLNSTVVPAFFIVEANLLAASLATPGAIAILLTSTYQFTQVDAKTDATNRFFFKGFPFCWDVMAVYMLVLGLNPWLNFGVLVLCNILIFVPIKFIYPTRTMRLKQLTLALTSLYGVLCLVGLILYPNEPKWIWWFTLTYGVYYVALSLWPYNRQPATLNGKK